MRARLFTLMTGLFLGFSLSRIGFSSWDEVHKMFVFSDTRLFSAFCFAALFLGLAWWMIQRFTGEKWPARKIHPGTLWGGALFGIGWALCGACPSIALVQLGEGQLAALITLCGLFFGNWLYSVVHERYFRWSARGCADE